MMQGSFFLPTIKANAKVPGGSVKCTHTTSVDDMSLFCHPCSATADFVTALDELQLGGLSSLSSESWL